VNACRLPPGGKGFPIKAGRVKMIDGLRPLANVEFDIPLVDTPVDDPTSSVLDDDGFD